MKIIITENQYKSLIKESYYDKDKLYSKLFIERRLARAPYSIKKYLNQLDEIECMDSQGKPHICVKIPQVVYVFLQGRY